MKLLIFFKIYNIFVLFYCCCCNSTSFLLPQPTHQEAQRHQRSSNKSNRSNNSIERNIETTSADELIIRNPCLVHYCGKGLECQLNRNGQPECLCQQICPSHQKRPVCGSDGQIYVNHCELHRNACIQNQSISIQRMKYCKNEVRRKFVAKTSKRDSNYLEKYISSHVAVDLKHNYSSTIVITKSNYQIWQDIDQNHLYSDRDSRIDRDPDNKTVHMDVSYTILPLSARHLGRNAVIVKRNELLYVSDIPTVPTDPNDEMIINGSSNCTSQQYDIMKDNLLLFSHSHLMAQSNNNHSKDFLVSIMFSHYDQNNNGHLEASELIYANQEEKLNGLSGGCQLIDMLKFEDTNEDHVLNINEFYQSFNKLYSLSLISLDKALEINHVSVRIGDDVEIKCDVTGTPPPRIMWTRNDVNLAELHSNGISVLNDGSLYLSKVKLIHTGKYVCYAQCNTDVKQTHILAVTTVPEVQVAPKFQSKRPGENAEIRCHISGEPFPSVEWLKNDVIINITTTTTATTTMATTTTTTTTTTQMPVGLTSEEPLSRTKNVSPVTPVQNNNISDPNEVIDDDIDFFDYTDDYSDTEDDPQIHGQRKTSLNDSDGAGTNKYEILGNGKIIRIRNISYSDTGAYMCQATNAGGRKSSISTLLVQEFTPSWPRTKNVSPVTPVQNNNISDPNEVIDDDIDFFDYTDDYSDTEDDPQIHGQRKTSLNDSDGAGTNKYEILGNGKIIRIRNISYSDTGAYMCQATNAGGRKSSISTLLVQEFTPSSILIHNRKFIVLHEYGIAVYESSKCRLNRRIHGNSIIPGTQEYLCGISSPNTSCTWGGTTNVGPHFIYISQPYLDRILVLQPMRLQITEIIRTDTYPVSVNYVTEFDQVWTLNWRNLADRTNMYYSDRDLHTSDIYVENRENSFGHIRTIQVIRQASKDQRHISEHPKWMVADHVDLVSNLFIPSTNPYDFNTDCFTYKFGYVTFHDKQRLYKLDLANAHITEYIDLTSYNCLPDDVIFSPLFGYAVISCRHPVTKHLEGQLIMDYLTEKVIQVKPTISGTSKISPDSQYLATVDHQNDSVLLIVQEITSNGLQFLFDVKTTLNVSDFTFFERQTMHGYDLYASATDKEDVLYLNLDNGKVEMITGFGPPAILPNTTKWKNPIRPIRASGIFGEHMVTLVSNAIILINGRTKVINCGISGILNPVALEWVPPNNFH